MRKALKKPGISSREEHPQSSAIPSTTERQWMHYCSPEFLHPPQLQANVAKGSKESQAVIVIVSGLISDILKSHHTEEERRPKVDGRLDVVLNLFLIMEGDTSLLLPRNG